MKRVLAILVIGCLTLSAVVVAAEAATGPGEKGYEGPPGNQGNGSKGTEGQPGNQGGK